MPKAAAPVTDELDNLSNNELRSKCVQYGLPNIPITDTSRKLLIKRLRTAIEGGRADSPAKGKSRRETIHVVAKVVEPERDASPKKNTRGTRRTIATPSEPEPEEPTVEVTVRQVTNRRRSRTTPAPAEPAPITTGKRKADAIIEDEDEDSDDVQIVHDMREQVARSSRSPSLAKSKMVTTSYQHVRADEPIVEEPAYKPRETIIPVQRESAYAAPRTSIHTQERESTTTSYSSRPIAQLSRPSLSTTNTSYTSNSTTRRYTTSGYKPQTEYSSISSSSTHNYKPQTTSYRDEEENSEDDAEDEVEAPFLSDFARRLSRLKAEPLNENLRPMEKEGSQYRESQRFYTTSIAGRRGINNKNSLGESIRQLWFALDRQYGLRKYLAVIALTLVVLFIYIMLVQN